MQDSNNADKSSVGSFKTCGDDSETATSTSFNKRNRLSQIITPPNRSACSESSMNQPETDQLILSDSTKDSTTTCDNSTVKTDISSAPVAAAASMPSKLSLNLDQPIANCVASNQPTTSDTSNSQLKNISKTAVLRHLFFSPISSNANPTETPHLASSKDTN